MPGFADRLGRVQVAATMQMTIRAREMRARGDDVLMLTVGEPDFPTPPHAIEAARQAGLRGETKYPPVDGLPVLKQAVQRKFTRDNGLDYALDEIMVANGGKQVIFDALMATLNKGDEVVIPAPYWSAYGLMTQLLGGVPVQVNCPQNNGFRLRPEDLAAAITPRTKWLILNFPNNPTGAACSRAEMQALGEVMLQHPDVWIMCDDMYEHLIFDGFEYVTMAAAEPRLRDRTLTLSGVSKTYAMTGWRIGFCGGPKNLIRAMSNMQGQATSGASSVSQAAAVAALDGPQELVAERAEVYRRRRDLVVDALNTVPGISCHRPEGAFYVYPNIAGCLGRSTAQGRVLTTDEDFSLALLEEQHVALVHGAAFGMSPYVRISYATDEATLTKACSRIGAFCEGLH
ncbi:MAG TPA: pyridoxal phosphate-dependent aminotransferase [Acidisoma sp.]|uniref:pyridoxal phosphate-dependent aminotransferase n=1 Tax=Acidisoma sp. TaxID=1872115 RepID=UPI002C45AE63|nr:pyridoxal phosphate-dependent aminotransferase [Acidisoma sp.]HTH99975.1 pyridoxal phosphate-dependent aminotransferase [Acidisoma sp.]